MEILQCYSLICVDTPHDWESYHRIRRTVLFANIPYDKDHPDEMKDGHIPLILKFQKQAIGTARLDSRDDTSGIIRLVAIDQPFQRQGHGAVLHALFVKKAQESGFNKLFVNADMAAIGFYRRFGWKDCLWDPEELQGIIADCWQMSLSLAPEL